MKKGSVRKESCRTPPKLASQTPSPMSSVSPTTRSPSPRNRQKSPSDSKSVEQRHQQLDITAEEMEAASEYEFHKDEKDVSPGVKYITESLLKSLSKQEDVACISSLNLSSPKDGDKKFKYIENLEKCSKLKTLSLSNNKIEKIEKLDKLMKLQELNLSYNHISKIEGIEHMQNLQKLNLAGNEIEHIPVWVGKKLRSLRILNLKQNKISSLHDIAKLKPLQDVTSLILADNPVVNLPHYRLYTIFHLRALENLDDQPVTNQDRQEALQRFNLEEVEKLERELENAVKEIENLKLHRSELLEQLHHQDEVNKALKEKALQQKQSYDELQRYLDTKNELLKQKTVELTRACQKHYELEQELAFYKIDAKFEPLNYFPPEDVELDNVPGESPYIGKARYKRNMFVREGYIINAAQQVEMGKMPPDEADHCRKLQQNLQLQTLDEQLEDKEKKIKSAQRKLEELQNAVGNAEQRVLIVTGELKQMEDALAQKKMSQADEESLEQQLSEKREVLNQLCEEALELEKQIEKQKGEIGKKQRELEDLQSSLASVNTDDPRHAHMRTQKARKEQQLDVMNEDCKQLESCLGEMLSRIDKETEEIKDLEQQLTDGQIATNEALKKDLESIIAGLQEYLKSVKHQAQQANDACEELRKDKEALLQKLADLEKERNILEVVAADAESMRNEIVLLESALQEQREINQSLIDAQGESSAYGAQLEAQLRDRDAEASQHREELERLKQLSQMELSALQAELEKERQALENALTKAQLAEEKEQQNNKLLFQFRQLQGDNNHLKQQLRELQDQLNHVVGHLLDPEEVLARVKELKEKLQPGAGEIKCRNSADVLGRSLADLQKELRDVLAEALRGKEKARARQRQLQDEVASQQEKLEGVQEKYRQARLEGVLPAHPDFFPFQLKAENRQNKNKVHQLENEIQRFHEKVKGMEEIQGFADQKLQEADEEKETILAQLEDLEKRKKLEGARAQLQFASLNKEMKELRRAVITSDKLAVTELSNAKNQLKALHGTVLRINQERAEEMEEAEESCAQVARAARDLARAEAEIELLQQLLKEKEEQLQREVEKAGEKLAASGSQKLEIDKLNEAVEQQKAEADRLRWLLSSIGTDNKVEIDHLEAEIAALRSELSRHHEYLTGAADPLKRRGYWCYVPSSQVSTPASRSTKDSGVCLRCCGTSPLKRGSGQDRKEDAPDQGGHWAYSPVRNGLHTASSGRGRRAKEEDEDSEEAPAAAGGAPVALGSLLSGPPPAGANVVYRPLPPHIGVPLIPVGVLHCNVPEHHDLEREVSRLEDTVSYLKSRKYQDQRSEGAEHKCKKELKKLHQKVEELLREREELECEVAELRQVAQRHKRRDFIDGCTDQLIAELHLEKSLKHHEDLAGEIECVEKTLLKRRAELREADRLLSEAVVELESTRGKTKDTIQKYNYAKQHLSRTEAEAKELERRAQDVAKRLMKADQQLRLLQANTRDLEQRKREQEGILKKINKIVAARDSEFQALNQKIEVIMESLQRLHGDTQIAAGNEEHHLQILKEAERLFQGKKTELERLKDQLTAQQQELLLLEQQLKQRREVLCVLQDHVSQKQDDLKVALQHGESEANEKLCQIRETNLILQELYGEKKDLDAQIDQRRSQLSFIKKDIGKEEENLQGILGQISKHRMELKHVLEILKLERNELESLKVQHNQKVDELEETRLAILEEKLKLENVQTLFQCQQGEVNRQEQLLEKDRQEGEHLASQLRTLQNRIEALNREKEKLEGDCQSLQKELSQTRRDLAAAEDNSRTMSSTVEKLELDVRNLQQEVDVLSKQKISLHGDVALVEKDLQEKKEELETLRGELNYSRQQLQLLEQELQNNTRHQEELLREQATLKEDIQEYLRRRKDCQERQKRRENHLQQLQQQIQEKEAEVAKQEAVLHSLKQHSEREEKKLEECSSKAKDQKILLEKELMEQQQKLEEVAAKLKLAEDNLGKLQEEASRRAALEESIRKSKCQLAERELQLRQKHRHIESVQKELEVSRFELKQLQDQMVLEREEAENRILSLKDKVESQRVQLERDLH
ncbi:CNTRL protein, partial [Rhinopomastus cyanomelas]|nr:CNTRL protein [Rhinopomastus cyanomelas]